MAAAGSKGRAIAGSFGKRICNRIWIAKHYDPAIILISRRASHSGSLYDKEIEEHVSQVPDHVIGTQSEKKYWAPHPTTGVFGPNDPKSGGAATVSGRPEPAESGNRGPSALDETVRFRHLELEDREIEDQN